MKQLSIAHDWLRQDPAANAPLGFTAIMRDNQTKGSARCDLLSWKDQTESEYLYPQTRGYVKNNSPNNMFHRFTRTLSLYIAPGGCNSALPEGWPLPRFYSAGPEVVPSFYIRINVTACQFATSGIPECVACDARRSFDWMGKTVWRILSEKACATRTPAKKMKSPGSRQI